MAVSDEEFRELNELCKQMYSALCVVDIISKWGKDEVVASLEAAEAYRAKREAA